MLVGVGGGGNTSSSSPGRAGLRIVSFEAASVFSGVPATCFGTGTSGSLWNSTCSGGRLMRTAQEWADAARAMYPARSR